MRRMQRRLATRQKRRDTGDRQTDGRQTETLRFPLDAASVKIKGDAENAERQIARFETARKTGYEKPRMHKYIVCDRLYRCLG